MQLFFAHLQLEQSQIARTTINELVSHQEEQLAISALLQQLGALKGTEPLVLPDPVRNELIARGICTAQDPLMTQSTLSDAELEQLMTLCRVKLEQLSMQIQSTAAYLQEHFGQYYSYLQGANIEPDTTQNTLTSLSQGQGAMTGTAGTGMLFTGLLAGAAIGVLGTLLVLRTKKKEGDA